MTNPLQSCNRPAWVPGLLLTLLLQLAIYTPLEAKHKFKTSSYDCDGRSPSNRSCLLRNVYFWDGRIYFLTKGGRKSQGPPEIDIRLPYSAGRQVNPVTVIGIKKASYVLKIEDGEEEEEDYSPVNKAVVWSRSRPHNIYHLLWEILPGMHMQACRWFKKCSYKPMDMVQLIFVDNQVTTSVRVLQEAVKCLSSLPYWEKGTAPASPVLIKQLVVGTGEENLIRVGGWLGPHRHRAGEPAFLEWQARMKACLGLAPSTTVQQVQPPVVTILQRPLENSRGRSFVNLDEVLPALKKLAPDFTWQVVALGSRMSLADQAFTFSNSSIIISSHGAQLTHLMWLPKGAVLVEVDQYGLEGNQFFGRHIKLMNKTNHVHYIRYTPRTPSSTVIRTDQLGSDRGFRRQKIVTVNMFSKIPHCDHWFEDQPAYHCGGWIKYFGDIRLEEDNLVDTVRAALGLLQQELSSGV